MCFLFICSPISISTVRLSKNYQMHYSGTKWNRRRLSIWSHSRNLHSDGQWHQRFSPGSHASSSAVLQWETSRNDDIDLLRYQHWRSRHTQPLQVCTYYIEQYCVWWHISRISKSTNYVWKKTFFITNVKTFLKWKKIWHWRNYDISSWIVFVHRKNDNIERQHRWHQ